MHNLQKTQILAFLALNGSTASLANGELTEDRTHMPPETDLQKTATILWSPARICARFCIERDFRILVAARAPESQKSLHSGPCPP